MVSDDHKMAMFGLSWSTLVEGLQQGIPEGDPNPKVTSEDLIDFFAMQIAAVIDLDITAAPSARRLSVEIAGKRIKSWLRDCERIRAKTGQPAIYSMITLGEGEHASHLAAPANDSTH